jgi:hypothetical protein
MPSSFRTGWRCRLGTLLSRTGVPLSEANMMKPSRSDSQR